MKFIFNFTFINVLKDGTDKLASHLPDPANGIALNIMKKIRQNKKAIMKRCPVCHRPRILQKVHRLRTCKQQWCRKCINNPYSSRCACGITYKYIPIEVAAESYLEGYQWTHLDGSCPACNRCYTKTGGCDHMQCTCGKQFHHLGFGQPGYANAELKLKEGMLAEQKIRKNINVRLSFATRKEFEKILKIRGLKSRIKRLVDWLIQNE